MMFEEFQDGRPGGHFENRNGTILAILNGVMAANLDIGIKRF